MNEGTWTIEPCERDAVATLARELSLSQTTAAVLVRRGYEDVAGARRFLEGALPAHDPFGLGDMAAACEAIRAAVAEGRRICVHGDYDADGICATTLAVLILRELGASCFGASAAPGASPPCRAGLTKATASGARRSAGSPKRGAGSC